MNLGDQEASCDLASEGRDLALSAVLNTSSEKISLNGTDLTLPAYSIAVLTEKQG